jgi:hypothetical protein
MHCNGVHKSYKHILCYFAHYIAWQLCLFTVGKSIVAQSITTEIPHGMQSNIIFPFVSFNIQHIEKYSETPI